MEHSYSPCPILSSSLQVLGPDQWLFKEGSFSQLHCFSLEILCTNVVFLHSRRTLTTGLYGLWTTKTFVASLDTGQHLRIHAGKPVNLAFGS